MQITRPAPRRILFATSGACWPELIGSSERDIDVLLTHAHGVPNVVRCACESRVPVVWKVQDLRRENVEPILAAGT